MKKKDKAGRKTIMTSSDLIQKVCFHLRVPCYNMVILGTRHYCSTAVAAAVAAHFVSRFIACLPRLARWFTLVRSTSMKPWHEKKNKEKNQRGCLMIMFLSLPSSVGTSAKHQLSEPEPQLASAGMVQAGQRGTQWHHSGILAAILPAHVVVW